MTPLERLTAASRNPQEAARLHKLKGGRVVAYVCDNVPVDLIVAAGAFPLRVHPSPARRSGASERLVDPQYTPDVSSRPPFISSVLDILLDGVLDFVDAVIVPNNRSSVQKIPRQLADAAQRHGVETPDVWFLDKAWAPGEPAREYNFGEIRDLRDRLAAWTGSVITSDALAEAICQCNAARAAALSVEARRRGSLPLAGSVAHDIFGAAFALHPIDFTNAVDSVLAEDLPSCDGPPLYLGGSPVDSADFYRLIEAAGANIVSEDHCWGARFADDPPSELGDPVEALAQRYHDYPACSIRVPFERTIDANLTRARTSGAAGAIFRVAAKDEVQMWETPDQLAAFRDAGIPCLHLRHQPYQTEPDSESVDQIRAFVAGIAQ